jgi:hypothetical protein
MEIIWPIFVVSAVVVALLWLYRSRSHPSSIEQRVRDIPGSNKVKASSGFEIWLEPGASFFPEQYAAVQAGLSKVFKRVKPRGYDRAVTHDAYVIAVLKGQKDSRGFPALRIPDGEYDGSYWDQGDYILVAGIVVHMSRGIARNIIAVPEHPQELTENLITAVEYEAEHVVLYHNDSAEYERTRVHDQNNGHPIIP